MYGICPKCLQRKQLTKHHILPHRWFKTSKQVYLCRECHNELEILIPYEKLPRREYYRILTKFLKGGEKDE